MSEYMCFGNFDEQAAGHNRHYFVERCTWLDFRGGLTIASTAEFGFGNKIFTWSHNIKKGQYSGIAVDRPVVIEDYAWITSCCVLYNCRVGHHAIVGIGSVVSGIVIPPWTIVRGNPARPVAHWNGKEWEKV